MWIYEELFDDDSANTSLESIRDYDSSYDLDDCEEDFFVHCSMFSLITLFLKRNNLYICRENKLTHHERTKRAHIK